MTEQERYQRYLASREWAVLKRAVHERAGGKCERCRFHPINQVHHLTYIRKYAERLDDLQGLCVGCHEFIHAKTDQDPIKGLPVMIRGRTIKSVYLAGKVAKFDWHRLNLDWREHLVATDEDGHPLYRSDWHESNPLDLADIRLNDGRRLAYTGPFLKSYGHSTVESGKHAGFYEDLPHWCLRSIHWCDLFFAWIDAEDCYGTIAEIGYARAKDKIILIAGPAFYPEHWFAYGLADRVLFRDSDVSGSFNDMVLSGDGKDFDAWYGEYKGTTHLDPIGRPEGPCPAEDAGWMDPKPTDPQEDAA